MISIDHVSKTFISHGNEFKALDDVSVKVERGEIFGIIGRSGAGKSTLLRLINYLEPPTAGRVFLDGSELGVLDAARLRQTRMRVGFVFQHFNLLSAKTVIENVRLPLRVAGSLPLRDQMKRVEEVLTLVGIADQSRKYPAALSGGQRQRVGIARALVNRPDILLCDEATSALDPETTQSILNLLLDVHRLSGITIVLVTHSMGVIRALTDRVLVLDRGRVVETGSVLDIILRPRHPVTRSLLAESGFEIQRTPTPDAGNARVVSLSYHGSMALQPQLTRLARESQLDFSILTGSAGQLKDTPYGQFTIEIVAANQAQWQHFLSLCDRAGIAHEVH